jgi:F-type H+-transporting ATPase subunit gamma
MSVELREVKRRIGGVRQIHKATSAMEKIASARLGRDKTAVMNSRRYAGTLSRTLFEIHNAAPESMHSLTSPSKGKNICVILFGSDRGLCGGFNTTLMDKMMQFREHSTGRNVRVIVMGKVVNRRATHQGYSIEQSFLQPTRHLREETDGMKSPSSLMPKEITQIAAMVTDSFVKGTYGEVHLIYSKFVSAMRQEPVIEKLLPVEPAGMASSLKDKPGGLTMAIFEPAPNMILDRLLPEYVRRRIYDAFLNSVASETGARQTAMRRATDNADEMITDLMLMYSQLRQEDITTQMIELASGSMR